MIQNVESLLERCKSLANGEELQSDATMVPVAVVRD